eukprot:CAMPEP_0197391208 /NCGR_PEP_ID=MMETSP1165-20131217/2939_1 /TAXON_ID=284809 /ORGANISM="Chrysocystis fragilis, Strain CCMP3189" /LENGTH=389 /DNA_ID=CAMNT_0042916773 /DNA_START=39 /DNA_END=1207 /DNA_ORIENTATION=+
MSSNEHEEHHHGAMGAFVPRPADLVRRRGRAFTGLEAGEPRQARSGRVGVPAGPSASREIRCSGRRRREAQTRRGELVRRPVRVIRRRERRLGLGGVRVSHGDARVGGGVSPDPELEAVREAEGADGELLGGEEHVPPEDAGGEVVPLAAVGGGEGLVGEGEEGDGDEVEACELPEAVEAVGGGEAEGGVGPDDGEGEGEGGVGAPEGDVPGAGPGGRARGALAVARVEELPVPPGVEPGEDADADAEVVRGDEHDADAGVVAGEDRGEHEEEGDDGRREREVVAVGVLGRREDDRHRDEEDQETPAQQDVPFAHAPLPLHAHVPPRLPRHVVLDRGARDAVLESPLRVDRQLLAPEPHWLAALPGLRAPPVPTHRRVEHHIISMWPPP